MNSRTIKEIRVLPNLIRRTALHLAAAVVPAVAMSVGPLLAAPQGELDATFGENGRLTIQGTRPIAGTAIQEQPDGQLLVSGYALSADDDYDFAILRTHPDGFLDSSFGAAGIVMVDFAGADDIATAMALQADGKIILAGQADMGSTGLDFAFARINPDGSLDATFDGDGRMSLDLGNAYEPIGGIVLLDSGQFVVAGTTSNGLDLDIVFARFDADGLLDTTFGTGLIAGTTLVDSGGRYDQPYALIRQHDGKYLACGASDTPELVYNGDMLAVRANADGSVDTGFGVSGITRLETGRQFSDAQSCLVMPDGSIILAGFHGEPGNVDLAFARLMSNGLRSSSFGNSGISNIEIGRISSAKAIALLSDNRLAVTGFTYEVQNTNVPTYMFFSVINPDSGLLDANFGNNGTTIIDFGRVDQPSVAEGLSLIQQTDGRLVAAGSAIYPGIGSTVALARVDPANIGNQGLIGFTASYAAIEEGISSIVLGVRRSGGSIGNVSVDYNTAAGSAQAPGDYSAASGTLTWMNGDVDAKLITVPITNDSTVENREIFTVVLANSTVGLTASEFLVEISDDDPSQAVVPPGNKKSGGGATGIELLILVALAVAAIPDRQSGSPFHSRKLLRRRTTRNAEPGTHPCVAFFRMDR